MSGRQTQFRSTHPRLAGAVDMLRCQAAKGLLGLALGLLLAACGSPEPVPGATVAPMGAPFEDEAATRSVSAFAEEEDWEPAVEAVSNQPPRFTGVQVDPAPNIAANTIVRVTAHAVDPEGAEVEYHYTWLVNDWEVDHEGPEYDASSLHRGDTLRVIVVADDGQSESDEVRSPLLTVTNGAPVILSQPTGTGPDGVFRYQLRVEDPEHDRNLVYRLAKFPRGMTVTPGGGLVQWRPSQNQSGTHSVHIVVEDSEGAQDVQTFELTIHPATS